MSAPVPRPDPFDRAEVALAELLPESRLPGLYTGPAWPLAISSPIPVRGWKRAVLRRRPGAGAEHWGHLFLLGGPSDRSWQIDPAGGLLADPRGERPDRVATWIEGHERLELWVRASSTAHAAELRALAQGLAERLEPDPAPSP